MSKFSLKGFLVIIMCFWCSTSLAQVKLSTWNIQHMGKSKTDDRIAYMAKLLQDFDVVALQEVVAGPGGAQAVARLADELNRTGAKWNYSISDPTKSSPYSSERYAYLWKTSQLKIVGKAWLDQHFVSEIEREPYMIRLKHKDEIVTLVSFHAVPKSKQPETEIKYFKQFPKLYPEENLIFLGDFNTPTTHTVFNPLKKMNYTPILENQKTSLRTKCIQNDCLASSYDHIFLNPLLIEVLDADVLHFYRDFENLKLARKISDHIPVWTLIDF
ncbi:MAG: endonuclease/exonuclease/phosphatase family protein [Bacteroidota bacterium]